MKTFSNCVLVVLAVGFSSFFANAVNGQDVIKGTLLYCVGGLNDDDNNNMQVLREELRRDYESKGAVIGYCEWNQASKGVREINAHTKKFGNVPVILLGHSYGGDTAIHEIAPKLARRISMIITLDPVSKSAIGDGNGTNRRPPNVVRWVNVYSVRKKTSGDWVAEAGSRWYSESEADRNIKTTSKSHEDTRGMLYKGRDEFLSLIHI